MEPCGFVLPGRGSVSGALNSGSNCRDFRAHLPVRAEFDYADLLASRDLTAVVWHIAAGLPPGRALPTVVFPVEWKGYGREKDVHDYAYSVLVSTYFAPSERSAKQGVAAALGGLHCEAEVCRFLKRFWQEDSRHMDDQKTGGEKGARRFRLRRLWMTWQPKRMPDMLEFVRWMARRYAAHDPELGWPAEVYAPGLTPLQGPSVAGDS